MLEKEGYVTREEELNNEKCDTCERLFYETTQMQEQMIDSYIASSEEDHYKDLAEIARLFDSNRLFEELNPRWTVDEKKSTELGTMREASCVIPQTKRKDTSDISLSKTIFFNQNRTVENDTLRSQQLHKFLELLSSSDYCPFINTALLEQDCSKLSDVLKDWWEKPSLVKRNYVEKVQTNAEMIKYLLCTTSRHRNLMIKNNLGSIINSLEVLSKAIGEGRLVSLENNYCRLY